MGLFAALDNSGAVRFVGEVENGAACACVCPTCGAPVLAKQGELNSWHFAHQPGQERPECEPGSINLLRRLAVERLVEQPYLTLPSGAARVMVDARFPSLNQTVDLHFGPATVQQWHLQAPRGSKVASFVMMDQSALALFVEIGPGDCALELDASPGALLYALPLPPEGSIRTELQALDFLKTNGRWHWRRLPDAGGRIERAKRELLARLPPLVAQWEQVQTLRRQQLFDDRFRGGGAGRERPVIDAPHTPEVARVEPPPAALPEWTSWKKDRTSFYAFERPQEEAVWVVFDSALHDGYFIVPAPTTFEGWDESLPASLGYVDLENGAIVGPGPVSRAVAWFYGTPGVCSRIDSDAVQILRFAHETAKG